MYKRQCPCDSATSTDAGCEGTGCESERAKKKRLAREAEQDVRHREAAGYPPPVPDSDSIGPYKEFFGRAGEADDDLNPSGFVTVDGVRLPGTTDTGTLIEAGSRVRVVKTDAFGVRVVRL